jgi:hypothetical protein
LRLYDSTDRSAGLREEIEALRAEIEQLQRAVSENEIRRKLRNALDRVESMASRLVPQLDAEWPDAPIRLMIDELTIKVIRGSRDDFFGRLAAGRIGWRIM